MEEIAEEIAQKIKERAEAREKRRHGQPAKAFAPEERSEAAGKGAEGGDDDADEKLAEAGEPFATTAVGDGGGVNRLGDERDEDGEEPGGGGEDGAAGHAE